VHAFEQLVEQKENELSILLGRNPGPIPRGLTVAEMPLPPAVPAGLPSDLVARRPDLRAIEETLIAANARVGEATALLYPSITLTGGYGWASTDLDNLLSAGSLGWSAFANVLQPIFNAGQNRSAIEAAESRWRQGVDTWQQAILQALREVNDALIGYRKAGERRVDEGSRVDAELKVLDLSVLRYRGGVSDYLQVLDAQRSLFAAQLDEATAVRDELVSFIQLYKALGGGWPQAPEPEDGAPQDGQPAAAEAGSGTPDAVAAGS
jgi:multidrug efflux system outer membrane protein